MSAITLKSKTSKPKKPSPSEKAKEFVATGGEIYHGGVPEGTMHDD